MASNKFWQDLKHAATVQQRKKRIVHDMQKFNQDISEITARIAENDVALSTDESGHDLSSVQTLLKKHESLELVLMDLEEKITSLKEEATRLCGIYADHEVTIRVKLNEIEQSWTILRAKENERRCLLKDTYDLFQFLSTFNELFSWINDMSSQCFKECQEELLSKITKQENQITTITTSGKQMITNGHFAEDEIKNHIKILSQEWAQLKECTNQRHEDMNHSLLVNKYFTDATKAEIWMKEIKPKAATGNLGKGIGSAKVLLKKHLAMMNLLEAFKFTISRLEEKAAICQQQMELDHNGPSMGYAIALADYTKILPLEVSMKENDALVLLDTTDNDWWKIEVNEQQGYVPSDHIKKTNSGRLAPNQNINDGNSIADRQQQLKEQYENMMMLGRDRQKKLKDSLQMFVLMRRATYFSQGITNTRELMNTDKDLSEDPEMDDKMLKGFVDFKADMQSNEDSLAKMNEIAMELMSLGQIEVALKIQNQIQELKKTQNSIQKTAQARQTQSDSKQETQHLKSQNHVAEEPQTNLQEEKGPQHSDQSVKSPRPAHVPNVVQERLQRAITSISDKKRQLEATASSIKETQPDVANTIFAKLPALDKMLAELTAQLEKSSVSRT